MSITLVSNRMVAVTALYPTMLGHRPNLGGFKLVRNRGSLMEERLLLNGQELLNNRPGVASYFAEYSSAVSPLAGGQPARQLEMLVLQKDLLVVRVSSWHAV